MIFYLVMVIGGIILIGFSFWAINFRSGFLEKIGGVLAPFGLIIALLGALLLAVPGFFSPLGEILGKFFE